MTEREAKIALMRWLRDALRQRLAVASEPEDAGLRVAVRMLEQQPERLEPKA